MGISQLKKGDSVFLFKPSEPEKGVEIAHVEPKGNGSVKFAHAATKRFGTDVYFRTDMTDGDVVECVNDGVYAAVSENAVRQFVLRLMFAKVNSTAVAVANLTEEISRLSKMVDVNSFN